MIDIPAVMRHIRPEATWTLDGDEYDGLTMTDGSEAPTFAEIEQAWPVVQQARQQAEVDRLRHAAYVAESDPLFFQWQRGEATEQQWRDKVAEIQARHPDPA